MAGKTQSNKYSVVPLVVVEVDGVNVKLPIVGEVGDVQRLNVAQGEAVSQVADNVIVWNPGVPKDPEMFAVWLADVNRINNPDSYRFRAVDGA